MITTIKDEGKTEFYGTQPDHLPKTLPDGTLVLERAGDLVPSGAQLNGARLDRSERGSYYGDGIINGVFFNRALVSADRIHWPSVPKQAVCGDKHFGYDVRCAREAGHQGPHREADRGDYTMQWVHNHEQAPAVSSWDGKDTERTTKNYVDAQITAGLKIGIDGQPVPEQPTSDYEFCSEQLAKRGLEISLGREGFLIDDPRTITAVACRSCSSPAAPGTRNCVYCAHSTHDGKVNATEADRVTAGAMLNEDAHPGIAAARSRNELSLASERPKPTKSSRQAALPHPWENGFSSSTWEEA